jgi:hypothetical protein
MRAEGPLVALVNRVAGRLRFPHLFLIVALLFLVDLVVPDVLPFADEILLGLATLLLARWKERAEAPAETG